MFLKQRSAKANFVLIVCILFASMTILGITEGIHGVTMPLMKNEYSASNQMQGTLSAIFTLSSVFAGFFTGYMLKKAGIKRALILGCVLNALPMLLLPLGSSFLTSSAIFLIMKIAFTINENAINGLAATASQTPGRMISLTHFFFGIGAMLGPIMASIMITEWGMTWKTAYLLDLLLIAMLLAAVLMAKISDPASLTASKTPEKSTSLLTLLKTPAILLFGITFAFIAQTEYVVNVWGAIYLQDAFGMDPAVGGASFLALFFFFFALSRLVFGLLLDRIGYERIIYFCMTCTILTLTAGFLLGENGIWILAFSGFFVAVEWPAMLAMVTKIFGRTATVAMTIACTVCSCVVVGLQLINGAMAQTFGGAWGYRMCLPYGVLSLLFFFVLHRHLKRKGLEECGSNDVK